MLSQEGWFTPAVLNGGRLTRTDLLIVGAALSSLDSSFLLMRSQEGWFTPAVLNGGRLTRTALLGSWASARKICRNSSAVLLLSKTFFSEMWFSVLQ